MRADGSQVALNPDAVSVDIRELESLAAGELDGIAGIAEVYQGDFLAGFSVRDHEFEDWLTAERRRLRDLASGALVRLVRAHADAGDAAAGIPAAETLARIDPLSELAHRALIMFFSIQGRRSEALQLYERFSAELNKELGVEPDADTRALVEAVRAGEPVPGIQAAPAAGIRQHGDYPAFQQDIRYCRSFDGTRLAYSRIGAGSRLIVQGGNWLTHLEEDTQSPVWRPLIDALSGDFSLLRYDQRGMGLSDWDIGDYEIDTLVADLEAVIDSVTDQPVVLLGMCQAAAVKLVYAARHPERVARLILISGLERGWAGRSAGISRQADAFAAMTLKGWGSNSPAFRQMFSSLLIPDARSEQLSSMNELQRLSASPENAVRVQQFMGRVDLRAYLPELKVPTLVVHPQGDPFIPLKEGKKLAAGIPQARFLPLPSNNHLPLSHEPAWQQFIGEVSRFAAL